MVTLSEEQRLAILSGEGRPVCVHDAETNAAYVIVDAETHQRAMEALRRQQDVDAIAEGIQDIEAGRVMTLDELDRRMHAEFGFPPRTS